MSERQTIVRCRRGRTRFGLAVACMVAVGLSGLAGSATWAAAPATQTDPAAAREQAVAKALEYLRAQGQADDGSFSASAGPAVTALVVYGVLRNGRPASDPLVARGLAYLEKFAQADGGIYAPDSNYRNYETALAVLAFAASGEERYRPLVAKADAFLKGLQWDESEGHDRSSTNYGGAGYGKSKRPDLSNTSFLIDALRAAGAGPNDPAVQKALVFVSRCQNLETEHNTTAFAAKNPDGGFYYTPAAGGTSQAGSTPEGGLRSYASMTYAGLKSMIFAGVGPDDPRVAAAVEWVRKHFDLTSNPGMGDAGLYYYYHTFAKALDALGQETFVDAEGRKHDWRAELAVELARRQRPDGAWINENGRWLEGDPNLVTAYALLALAYCRTP